MSFGYSRPARQAPGNRPCSRLSFRFRRGRKHVSANVTGNRLKWISTYLVLELLQRLAEQSGSFFFIQRGGVYYTGIQECERTPHHITFLDCRGSPPTIFSLTGKMVRVVREIFSVAMSLVSGIATTVLVIQTMFTAAETTVTAA